VGDFFTIPWREGQRWQLERKWSWKISAKKNILEKKKKKKIFKNF